MAVKFLISQAIFVAVLGLSSAGLLSSVLRPAGTIDLLIPSNVKDALASTAKFMRNLTVPVELETFIANETVPVREKVTGPTVRFYLFADPSDPHHQEELFTGDLDSLKKSHYDPSKPVKILVPGWTELYNQYRFIFPWSTKDAYFAAGNDYNVIIVDYTRTTGFFTYVLSITVGLIEVREQGADFLCWLHQNGQLDLDQTHIIGYSLGGQYGPSIAAEVKSRLGQPIGRLTGIDPAGPGFYPQLLASHVISKDDAKYVDIYHADGNIVGLGIEKNVGHVDYWINGGRRQPICIEEFCSHLIAPYYYEATVRKGAAEQRCACVNDPMSFNSYRTCCDVKIVFGEYNNGTTGSYYVPYPATELMPTVVTAFSSAFVSGTKS